MGVTKQADKLHANRSKNLVPTEIDFSYLNDIAIYRVHRLFIGKTRFADK